MTELVMCELETPAGERMKPIPASGCQPSSMSLCSWKKDVYDEDFSILSRSTELHIFQDRRRLFPSQDAAELAKEQRRSPDAGLVRLSPHTVEPTWRSSSSQASQTSESIPLRQEKTLSLGTAL